MTESFKNFINGKLVPPVSGEYFENLNPADNRDIVGLFPKSGQQDIESAVQAAKKAFPAWSTMPPPGRGELIYKAADLLLKNQEALARVIVREMGKTLPESMGDIKSSADVAYFTAGEGRRMYGQTSFSALEKRWALTKRSPVGVCGLLTAWNAPMAIITWKLFPALICGNAVVLKPSEDTPLTAHLLGELLKEAGFPDGVVNIVYGIGDETGKALVKNKDVDLISFTGSTKVGKMIAEECGRQLKRCSLELGGKNGLIVMNDADLVSAAKAVASGAFSTAGQRCASTSRVFVHEAVYDTFLGMLLDETAKMKVGVGSDPETKVCPIINKRQFDSIMSYIEGAKKDGAKILCGGHSLTGELFSKGCFIEPTIFADVDIQSGLAREEIFGPVLAVFRISNVQEALEKINSVEYGLTASIFTSNVDIAMIALEKLQAGCCYVNAPTFGSEPHMPFGGVKQSGNGSREPGTQAMDVFSEWKTIYIDYSGIARNSQFKTT
jgi:alpha-ketoglutaric semialdehyde dehydrogenase